MTDEFEDLKSAMDAVTPPPDPSRRVQNLHRAHQIFDASQGSAHGVRPIPERRRIVARLISGGSRMLHSISTRGGLVATTALVAFGLVYIWPIGGDVTLPTQVVSPDRTLAKPAPIPATSTVQGGLAQLADEEFDTDDLSTLGSLSESSPVPSAEALVVSEPSPAVVEGFSTPTMLGAPAVMSTAKRERIQEQAINTESFANEPASALKITALDPVSTFSIDVDTASYSVIRSSLMAGQLPPANAVRIEEMINYFPYDYPVPTAGQAPFRPSVSVMQTPWNSDTQLVHIALQGRVPETEARPPLNLVFLIDTSGSMQSPNKLPLLIQSFRLMLGQLNPQDQVAIVAYAGSSGQVLEPTPASDRDTILAALEHLSAGGSTAGQAGLQQAYSVAQSMATEGEVTRVILATDGDFNVGLSDPDALKEFIADKRESGTYLSVLGFGRGNLDDTTMQTLAQNGNGTAAYIDTLAEAQKVLVDQLSGALFPIADDVKIQVEFNPARVAEYRLLGYETRALAREDFNNDRVDAGEIGAGASVTALYEITLVGSPATLNDPLRYQSQTDAVQQPSTLENELGFLRLRYKEPGQSRSELIEMPILSDSGSTGTEAQFAVAIAGFGQLLRGSDYLGDWSWDQAVALANGALGNDPFGYRHEAVRLMRLAKSLTN